MYTLSIGHYLVIEDDLKKSDAIIVFMGSNISRILYIEDLYQEKYAEEIIFTENYIPGEEYLPENINYITGAQASKKLLIDLGITEDNITFLQDKSYNTFDEVVNITKYLKGKSYERVILVTSPYHSRRTNLLFKKSIKKNNIELEIINSPTKYENFEESTWFTNRENFTNVILETLKLINYFLIEQFNF